MRGIEVVLKFYSRSLHCPACLLFMAAGGEGGVKYEARWLIAKSPPKISFKRMRERGQYYMIRGQLVWGSVHLMPTIQSQDARNHFLQGAFLPMIWFWVCVGPMSMMISWDNLWVWVVNG